MSQGPNVKKLIATKMSLLMIPPGTQNGLQAGIEALTKPGNIAKVAKEATEWVNAAIYAVKSAPDNPYTTDEEIAGEILSQIEKRKQR